MLLRLMALFSAVVHTGFPQGAQVLQQAASEESQSVIVTSKTRAFLSCESGDMVVRVDFATPFRGLLYAHRSRDSPCALRGDGSLRYELRIPLKGCGTWQDTPRVFMNNVTIRFHPALELEEDETKTVVCRYPPPLTPSPGSVVVIGPVTPSPSPGPAIAGAARLSEVEILILICLLLFLSLVTLGIGIAYFCLKRRNIRVVRKSLTATSAPSSQLTKLSSSRLQTPSSVLGHTVRIPRAVVSRGRACSALSEPNSSSETSSSSEGVDRRLLFRKGGSRSFLSIPKAILRKNGFRSRALPAPVHRRPAPSFPRATETEDQVVSATLEPENNLDEEGYYAIGDGSSVVHRRDPAKDPLRSTTQGEPSSFPMSGEDRPRPDLPVYAQVDRSKKRSNDPRRSSPQEHPGSAKRRQMELPEELTTTEEVERNTTVTTSVRKEITERRLVSPAVEDEAAVSTGRPGSRTDPGPKNLLIRDVSDVYVTTTVETELRESTTTAARDCVEETTTAQSTHHAPVTESAGGTASWNVVIRQRKPDVDRRSPAEEASEGSVGKPHFDVTIRTISPVDVKPKKQETLMRIPRMEVPQSVHRLREALGSREDPKPRARPHPRTVRWFDDAKEFSAIPEEESSIGSSASFRSEESLRERSSSEVLEVAPTLPGHRRASEHPMLERSTSEIVTSPDEHVRWVGGVAPVLESLSPEFLANIPTVAAGGFFNREKTAEYRPMKDTT